MVASTSESEMLKVSKENNAASETARFAAGVWKGAIEAPVNGVVQIANHFLDINVPELHLVDNDHVQSSKTGQVGDMVGSALGAFLVAKKFGAFREQQSLSQSMLRGAAAGFVSSAILQPGEEGGNSLLADRAKHGAVGAMVMLQMSFGNQMLNRVFSRNPVHPLATDSARPLSMQLLTNGTLGAMGGFTSTESGAVLVKGRQATWDESIHGTVTGAAAGMLFGSINFAGHRALSQNKKEYHLDQAEKLTVISDRHGNPTKISFNGSVNFEATKGPVGDWSSFGQHSSYPKYKDVTVQKAGDGSLTVDMASKGLQLNVAKNGEYAVKYAPPGENHFSIQSISGTRVYDRRERLTDFSPAGSSTAKEIRARERPSSEYIEESIVIPGTGNESSIILHSMGSLGKRPRGDLRINYDDEVGGVIGLSTPGGLNFKLESPGRYAVSHESGFNGVFKGNIAVVKGDTFVDELIMFDKRGLKKPIYYALDSHIPVKPLILKNSGGLVLSF